MADKTGDKLGDKPREADTAPQTSWETRERQAGGHTKKALRTPTVKCLGNYVTICRGILRTPCTEMYQL